MPAAPVSRTERRKFPRKDVIGSQLVSVDVKPQNSSALLLDISDGGFALQNLQAMRPGGTREVSFRIPETGARINVSALVVWKNGDRAGLRLVRVDENARPALGRWLRTLPDAPHQNVNAEPEGVRPAASPRQVPAATELRDEDFYSVTARARVVTCATGAAMAWHDAEGMVCRASTGLAPVTGARVQLDQGLSGECIRTASVVHCEDTENDPRVDPEVCRQLNLRSTVIVPVLREGNVAGLIEVFSSKPNAFRSEDVAGLKLLAEQCSTGTVVPKIEPEPEEAPLQGFSAAPQKRRFGSLRYRTFLPWVVGGLLLIAGARLAFRNPGPASAASGGAQAQADLAATPVNAAAQTAPGIPRDVTEAFFGKGDAAARSVLRKQHTQKSIGANSQTAAEQQQGEDDEVVVRQAKGAPSSPAQQPAPASAPAAEASNEAPPAIAATDVSATRGSLAALNVPPPALPSGPTPVARTSSEVTPARLVHTVKPGYPPAARAANIQGPVSLRVKVDAFGSVREVSVVSGAPELTRAAVAAVRRWRYEPFKLNGKPVDGETNVTVVFSIKGR